MKRFLLIINADDLGMSPEVDSGIHEAVSLGVVTSATMMVNPPFRGDFKGILSGGASVGIHFNLSLGRPCLPAAKVPSLVDSDGNFCQDLNVIFDRLDEGEARLELSLQLEAFRNQVGSDPCQITFHKHLHARHDGILGIMLSMAREMNVPLRALDERMRKICWENTVPTTDNFLGDVQPSPFWTISRLEENLEVIRPGITELMCHPAKGMKPVKGVWYEKERDTELSAFTSDRVRNIISRCNPVNFTKAFPREKR